jgi:protein PhnA
MSLKNSPELQSFLSIYFSSAEPENDEHTTKSFLSASSPEKQNQVIIQSKKLMEKSDAIVEVLGMEANRWFADASEAQEWMGKILTLLSSTDSGSDSGIVVTKDSNGAVLNEGDAVTVIKDLKVKGGSSDLKRGDLIKKVHLIGDPDNVECNVNGSTLVLKTCFLKRA